jgi:hypothetical protein
MGTIVSEQPTSSADLNSPPPLPDSTKRPAPPKDENLMSLGQAGASPEAMVLSSLAQIEQGSKILATMLPGLSGIVGDLIGRLRASIPQALSQMSGAGPSPMGGMMGDMGQPGAAPSPMAGPPGMPATPSL